MTAAIIALIAVGTGISAYSAYQQGQAAKSNAEYQNRIAQYNAQVAKQQADYDAMMQQRQAEEAKLKAGYEAKLHEKRGEELQARQRALYGKSGVLFRGSPLAVIESTAMELEMDKQMILREGRMAYESGMYGARARKQFGEMEADILRMQGSATLRRGRYAARGATLSSIGTLLTGAGQAGYMGYMMKD